MKKTTLNRRRFLQHAAGTITFPLLLSRPAPSDQINLAMLGVGSRAGSVMNGFARNRDARIRAVCDPFLSRQKRAQAKLNKIYGDKSVAAYTDFRKVLDRDDIDAVVICSCDHWHIPLAIAAAEAGKDMYVEKPLGISLPDAFRLRKAVNANGRVFQYGTQQRSSGNFRLACELVRNGYIGKVKHIDVWCIDGTRAKKWMLPKSVKPEPIPAELNYDLWEGPAPHHPYNHYRVHREGSFHTYTYSLGFIAGWGAHPLDIAQWGMNADHSGPVRYAGRGKIPTTGGLYSTVYDWDVDCRYGDGTTMHFMSHRIAKPVVMKYRKRWSDHGTTFFGTKGWISIDRSGMESDDLERKRLKPKPGELHLTMSKGHDRNFLDCIKTREPTLNPVESAIRSDTISHLSDLAIRTGRVIKWNPVTEKIIDDKQAMAMLHRPQRAPYQF